MRTVFAKFKFMKKLFYCFGWLALLSLVACETGSESEAEDLLALVPPKTAAIVKTKDLSGWSQKLRDNSFVSENPGLPVRKFFDKVYTPLNDLEISGNSLLLFSKIGHDDINTALITASVPKLLDSVGYEKIEDLHYGGQQIKRYKTGGKTLYSAQLNDLFVFGDSKLVIENMVRLSNGNLSPDKDLQKAYKTTSGKEASFFVKPSEFKKVFGSVLPHASSDFLKKFTKWTALDLDLDQNGFRVDGVGLTDRKHVLGLFKNTEPRENKIAEVVPSGATGFYSFTYDDFDKLKDNLSFYRKGDYPDIDLDLLTAAHEIGMIYENGEKALAVKSNDPENGQQIKGDTKVVKSYRGIKIFRFDEPNYFSKALAPLVQLKDISYYTKIEDFFVFGQDKKILETIIANVRNKSTLAEKKDYAQTVKNLSTESSLLVVGITDNLMERIAESVSETDKKAYQDADVLDYNYAALQFIDHDDFAYINGVFEESEAKSGKEGGSQIENIKPAGDSLTKTWFFENWRTHQYDIVAQGESNTLYAYDKNGNLRWKKELDGQIRGDIKTIDIYQNTRKQMAFVTPHKLYVVDRDGNEVSPFPKEFNDPITQGLSVFDYENNGKYRFVVTQDNNLLMYDKTLKPVKGFEFSPTKTPIGHRPWHFAIHNKDYIVVPEESGEVHLLNRQGQTRVQVKGNPDLSNAPWFNYQDKFTSTDKAGNLIQIDQNGGLQEKDLELGDEHGIYATSKTLATFAENELTINGETTKLDYGLYTDPEIFYRGDKLYIAITDTQAHKVYLFDSNANLLPGFPVYGNSTVDIQNMDNRGGPELIVLDEDGGVLVYDVHND